MAAVALPLPAGGSFETSSPIDKAAELEPVVGVAYTPLTFTVLVPRAAPKFVPLIVTATPTAPLGGDSDVIVTGATVTVNVTPLLATPPTVTVTSPVAAPPGTVVTTLVADH